MTVLYSNCYDADPEPFAVKNIVLTGFGHITLLDLDTIDLSNLNRQFLFHKRDIGKFKSEVAAAAVAEMNPDLKGHILCKQEPVGENTESLSNVFRLCDTVD